MFEKCKHVTVETQRCDEGEVDVKSKVYNYRDYGQISRHMSIGTLKSTTIGTEIVKDEGEMYRSEIVRKTIGKHIGHVSGSNNIGDKSKVLVKSGSQPSMSLYGGLKCSISVLTRVKGRMKK